VIRYSLSMLNYFIDRELQLLGLDGDVKVEVASGVRQSRRIAQIKIKEDEDRRVREAAELAQFKKNKVNKGNESKSKKKNEEVDNDYVEDSDDDEEDVKKKAKKEKKAFKFNDKNPWQSSSDDSDEQDEDHEEEEYDIEDHDQQDHLVVEKSGIDMQYPLLTTYDSFAIV